LIHNSEIKKLVQFTLNYGINLSLMMLIYVMILIILMLYQNRPAVD